MLDKIKEVWNRWSDTGVRIPFVYDTTKKESSVTLMFAWVTFAAAFISLILLHVNTRFLTATLTTMGMWVTAVIFYRLRKLDKVKFDLQNKSLELDGEDEKEEGNVKP